MTPRVSVLFPCREAAPYLHDCIRSLQAQTLSDFQVIAVDDGSRDDTGYILDEWAAQDQRVVVVHTEGIGLIDALNAALMRGTGELIARMDADDIAEPERLEKQVALLDANADVAACGTHVRYFPRDLLRDGALAYEAWINSIETPDELERDLFVECPIAHPTLMIRRTVLSKLRGYRDEGWPEDYDLILRLVEAGHRLANVPEVLHAWRERPDRLSRVDPRYSLDAFTRCKVHFLRRMRLRRRPVAVWGAGPAGKAFARELREQRIEVRAFVDVDVKKIGQTIHDLRVIGPDDLEEVRDCYCVSAVANVKARNEIRAAVAAARFVELEDFCAVA